MNWSKVALLGGLTAGQAGPVRCGPGQRTGQPPGDPMDVHADEAIPPARLAAGIPVSVSGHDQES